jgi:hypothetical protein
MENSQTKKAMINVMITKSEFHIIFTVHSVLYNSFYFNQHMHYNFVVIYTPTYVSTTY